MKWEEFFIGFRKVLDAGCGECRFVDAMRSEGIACIGIDLYPARKDVLKVDINKKLPFRNEEFDGIHCSHVMEHLERPESTLKEFHRILDAGGLLVLRVPHFMNQTAWTNLDHKRAFSSNAFLYLEGWELIRRGFTYVIPDPPPTFKSRILNSIFTPLTNAFPNAYERFFGYWFGGCEEMYCVLRKK